MSDEAAPQIRRSRLRHEDGSLTGKVKGAIWTGAGMLAGVMLISLWGWLGKAKEAVAIAHEDRPRVEANCREIAEQRIINTELLAALNKLNFEVVRLNRILENKGRLAKRPGGK